MIEHKGQISRVAALCAQVEKLCYEWQEELRLQWESELKHPDDYSQRYWPRRKVSAALRRRSMDLTRALADLRARDR